MNRSTLAGVATLLLALGFLTMAALLRDSTQLLAGLSLLLFFAAVAALTWLGSRLPER
jgi:hypothetical protein